MNLTKEQTESLITCVEFSIEEIRKNSDRTQKQIAINNLNEIIKVLKKYLQKLFYIKMCYMTKITINDLETYYKLYPMSLRHKCWSGAECYNESWCRTHGCKRGLEGELSEMTTRREELIKYRLTRARSVPEN